VQQIAKERRVAFEGDDQSSTLQFLIRQVQERNNANEIGVSQDQVKADC
jgi:hypothetical protein